MSEPDDWITGDEAYEMSLESVDRPAADRLFMALVTELFPIIRKSEANHATVMWALGKAMAGVIAASKPDNPEIALMAAMEINRTMLHWLEEKQVGGVRQTGRA